MEKKEILSDILFVIAILAATIALYFIIKNVTTEVFSLFLSA
jgi:hypothetical protein